MQLWEDTKLTVGSGKVGADGWYVPCSTLHRAGELPKPPRPGGPVPLFSSASSHHAYRQHHRVPAYFPRFRLISAA